jgi:hypothetical protein
MGMPISTQELSTLAGEDARGWMEGMLGSHQRYCTHAQIRLPHAFCPPRHATCKGDNPTCRDSEKLIDQTTLTNAQHYNCYFLLRPPSWTASVIYAGAKRIASYHTHWPFFVYLDLLTCLVYFSSCTNTLFWCSREAVLDTWKLRLDSVGFEWRVTARCSGHLEFRVLAAFCIPCI